MSTDHITIYCYCYPEESCIITALPRLFRLLADGSQDEQNIQTGGVLVTNPTYSSAAKASVGVRYTISSHSRKYRYIALRSSGALRHSYRQHGFGHPQGGLQNCSA